MGLCFCKTVCFPAYDDEQSNGTAAVSLAVDGIRCGFEIQFNSGMLFCDTFGDPGKLLCSENSQTDLIIGGNDYGLCVL